MSLMKRLPDAVYNEEPHVRAFQDAIEKQVVSMQESGEEMRRQARPSTATSWGMALYERGWGLTTDESKPLEQRLSAWRARRRGVGTTTAEAIKNIAKSFYNGNVDVVEHKKEFWFEVILKGLPPNMADLQMAIEEVKPAHMEAVYVVTLESAGAAYAGPAVHEVTIETVAITGEVGEMSPSPIEKHGACSYLESTSETYIII